MYMMVTTWLENVASPRSSGTYLRYRDKQWPLDHWSEVIADPVIASRLEGSCMPTRRPSLPSHCTSRRTLRSSPGKSCKDPWQLLP
jgi:hypothetical protein